MGKNFDCSGGFCPLMVTADELPARKPNPIWMKPGDVCEIEGVLRNPIQDEGRGRATSSGCAIPT